MKKYFVLTILLLTFLKPTTASVLYMGDGYLSLFNTHLNEEVTVQYRFDDGSYSLDALKEINHALRCRMTGKHRDIEIELLELIDQVQDHYEAEQIQVVSAYRSPEMNAQLRRMGRKVASKSLHMHGQAMDIRVPGIPTRSLRDYVISLKRGGVGYYPYHKFVHIDIGQVRTW